MRKTGESRCLRRRVRVELFRRALVCRLAMIAAKGTRTEIMEEWISTLQYESVVQAPRYKKQDYDDTRIARRKQTRMPSQN